MKAFLILCWLMLFAFAAQQTAHKKGKSNIAKPQTLFYLGIMEALSGNYKKAATLYEKACNKGCAERCNNLGLLYANGQGVRQSYTVAKEFFGKACDLGFQKGCDNYAILNKKGY